MTSKSNVAISVESNHKIVPLGIITSKEAFNKFYAVFSDASWDNKVISASSFLSLPISTCMTDPSLKLLKETEGMILGHDTLQDFVCSDPAHFGLGMKWEDWNSLVTAMIKKLEFGINSSSPHDVLLQIEDVAARLGREPVSKFEFNLAKDKILQEQVSTMQKEHSGVVTEMRGKVSDLMLKLEGERREKLTAIERLDSALEEIKVLSDVNQKVDLREYVERSLYDKIVDEMGELKLHHETLLESYLVKISKLSITSETHKSQIKKLQALIERRNEEIASLSVTGGNEFTIDRDQEKEIEQLKRQVIGLLKKNIHKQKVINKQKIISSKKTQINNALRERQGLSSAQKQSNKVSKPKVKKQSFLSSKVGLSLICSVLSTSFLVTLYTIF